jgi:ferritin-like metal-binding protein YciE
MSTLQDLFLDEIKDMYDAEKRIAKALPKLAKAATNVELQEAFSMHAEETQGHIERLEQIFSSLGEKPKGKTCKATVGLLEEADEILSDNKGSPTINAALISAAQKVEHYEAASYGTLREWAELLGNEEAADLLGQTLEEEEAADDKLTDIAESAANEEALGEEEEDEDTSDAEDVKSKRMVGEGTGSRKGSKAKSSSRR